MDSKQKKKTRNFKETVKKFVSHDKGDGFCIPIKSIVYWKKIIKDVFTMVLQLSI